MRDLFGDNKGLGIGRGGEPGNGAQPGVPAGLGQGLGGKYPLEGRYVCPFCGSVNETMEGPCPQCTMTNTAETRKATKSRIGPWYVLQSRNPAAPGMKYDTLLGFVRKGRVKARSIVRGPTTHQLWRFACQVKGLSREFGLCYSCGGSIEREAQLCPQCNRLQDPPVDPDVFVEGQAGGAAVTEAPVQAAAPPAPAPAAAPVAAVPMPTPTAPTPITPTPAVPTPPTFSQERLPAVELPPGDLRTAVFKEIPIPPPLSFPAVAPPAAASPSPAPAPMNRDALPTARPPIAPIAPPPQAAPPPTPFEPARDGPRKRHAQDVILDARELAAAFQLDFDGPEPSGRGRGLGSFDGAPPWAGGQASDERAARPAPRRRRRKRRVGRVLLVLVLLAAGGFAAALAINLPFRRRVFDWAEAKYMALTGANLYPDLVRQRGASAGAPVPAASGDDLPDGDRAYTAAAAVAPAPLGAGRTGTGAGTRPAMRPIERPAPPTVADRTPAPQPQVSRPQPQNPRPENPRPAATQPTRAAAPTTQQQAQVTPEAPGLTLEQAQRKSHDLWVQALDAEERGDYAKAKSLYEQMMKLPREAWYQGVEARLRGVKNELGEK